MECDICSRSVESAAAPTCAACTRNQLYPLRIQHAQVLLEKSELAKQIDGVLATRPHSNSLAERAISRARQPPKDIAIATKSYQHDNALDKVSLERDRVDRITMQADLMRQRNNELRIMIEAKQRENAEQQGRIERSKSAYTNVHPFANDEFSKANAKDTERQSKLSANLVSARTFLCRETAAIMGLNRKSIPSTPNGRPTQEVLLGFIPALDLRNLVELRPERITASLTYTVRLVHLACQYLSVRPPAEIIHPHSNYPHGTIFWPNSSYLTPPEALFFPHPYLHEPHPGSGGASPKASRELEKRGLPRSRPLFVYQKLSVLVKEDPQGFSHFIEGISLLAWDVAWLCRSQGLAVADSNWEEVAAVGNNLWRLLGAPIDNPPIRPGSNRQTSSRHVNLAAAARIPSNSQRSQVSRSKEPRSSSPEPNLFGQYSHNSAQNFIRASIQAGTMPQEDESQRWKFYNPHKVIDKTKSLLLQEISGAEWEILEDGDFHDAETGLEAEGEEVLRGAGIARDEPKTQAASTKAQKGYMKIRERSAP